MRYKSRTEVCYLDFGKQSTNFYTANPPSRYIHHFSWHFTCRQLCFFFFTGKYPNSVFLSPATLLRHLGTHSLFSPSATPLDFSVFTPASESEIYKILSVAAPEGRSRVGFSLCEAAERRRRDERGAAGAETSAEGARVEAP